MGGLKTRWCRRENKAGFLEALWKVKHRDTNKNPSTLGFSGVVGGASAKCLGTLSE